MPPLASVLSLLAVAIAATGCATGRGSAYHTVVADVRTPGAGPLALATHDRRAYVLSGTKPPAFVGVERGRFGGPSDVATPDGRPLAQDISQALASSLKRAGFTPVVLTVSPRAAPDEVQSALARAARRAMLLTVREWQTDTAVNTTLTYDVSLAVIDPSGRALVEKRLSGRDELGGSTLNPTRHAREAIPRAFKAKLEALLNDPDVQRALGAGG